VLGVVNIAEKTCKERNAAKVDVIELEIGELAGVEKSALDFAWPVAVKDTRLEHAEKVIDWVKGKAHCLECNTDFDIHSLYDSCPNCKGYFKDIQSGRELKVKSLVIS
jgi:hydrogenase nickel incorporation protein HypA/HybF